MACEKTPAKLVEPADAAVVAGKQALRTLAGAYTTPKGPTLAVSDPLQGSVRTANRAVGFYPPATAAVEPAVRP